MRLLQVCLGNTTGTSPGAAHIAAVLLYLIECTDAPLTRHGGEGAVF